MLRAVKLRRCKAIAPCPRRSLCEHPESRISRTAPSYLAPAAGHTRTAATGRHRVAAAPDSTRDLDESTLVTAPPGHHRALPDRTRTVATTYIDRHWSHRFRARPHWTTLLHEVSRLYPPVMASQG